MKEYTPYLCHQVARFGALTVQQMQMLCQGRCKRSTLYRTLSQLLEDGLLARISHRTKPLIGYAATRDMYVTVYGESHIKQSGPKSRELDHAIRCADVMIALARYRAVTGLATEHEWTPEEIREFCHNRIPDGIIQVTQGDLSYEIAVEVESSIKSDMEVTRILTNYRQTFLRNMPCVGVMIVATSEAIRAKYERLAAALPSEIEDRVLITTPQGLSLLNPKYYGAQVQDPAQVLELRRTGSKGSGNYYSMKSASYGVPIPA